MIRSLGLCNAVVTTGFLYDDVILSRKGVSPHEKPWSMVISSVQHSSRVTATFQRQCLESQALHWKAATEKWFYFQCLTATRVTSDYWITSTDSRLPETPMFECQAPNIVVVGVKFLVYNLWGRWGWKSCRVQILATRPTTLSFLLWSFQDFGLSGSRPILS